MMKKVYIVLFTLSLGGAEKHASSIANYLLEQGLDVTIVLLQDDIIAYNLNDGVKVAARSDVVNCVRGNMELTFAEKVKLKIYSIISAKKYARLDRYMYINQNYLNKLDSFFQTEKEFEDSVVISFMTIPNICAAVLKKKYRYKLILGEFTSPQFEFSKDDPENYFKRLYYKNADGFVFQTAEQKEYYSFLNDKVRMKVIPNPLEPNTIEPYDGIRQKEIVNYCKYVKVKNLPLLISAFSRLVAEYPEYRLVIYGDGPQREEIEKCVAGYRLEEKVMLKPYAANVLSLVRESAMFVSSSDREGISNSMLEAMSIGLPVVCTDCPAGGARMFIRPYENGILTPVGDAEALYKAMKYVIENPDKAKKMGAEAVNIRNILNKEKILNQWVDFIVE